MELWVLLLIIAVPLLIVILIYNRLVGLRNVARNSFANIDAQLKKRYDLIPNLVASVQQYMKHEAGTLQNLTELRAKAVRGGLTDDQKVEVDNEIRSVMSGLMVNVENYPDLKASENFNQLQRSLNEIEEQLAASRRSYNMSVTQYNTATEVFPTSIIANMFNFTQKELFRIEEQERQNVNVKDLFKS